MMSSQDHFRFHLCLYAGAVIGVSVSYFVSVNSILVGVPTSLGGLLDIFLCTVIAAALAIPLSRALGRSFADIAARNAGLLSGILLMVGFKGLGFGEYNSFIFSMVILFGLMLPVVVTHARYAYPRGSQWPMFLGDGHLLSASLFAVSCVLMAGYWHRLPAASIAFLLFAAVVNALANRTANIPPPGAEAM